MQAKEGLETFHLFREQSSRLLHLISMNGWYRSFDHAPRRLPEARLEAEFTAPVRLRAGFGSDLKHNIKNKTTTGEHYA
jgi:hypothetical protein